MKPSKLKSPAQNTGKKIEVSEDTTFIRSFEHPVFCFKHLHKKYNLEACTDADSLALIKTVCRLSQLTWNQIKVAPRHGLGVEKIALNSIRPALPISFTGDVHHLYALRFSGLKPMVGHINKFVFQVMYLDHDFTVYNHG